MSKITLSVPNSPYSSEIETGVMEVSIDETFLPVKFESLNGEIISVCQRDSGFVIVYAAEASEMFVELKGGLVKVDRWV